MTDDVLFLLDSYFHLLDKWAHNSMKKLPKLFWKLRVLEILSRAMADKVQGGCCLFKLKELLPMDSCNDYYFDDFQKFIYKQSKGLLGKMSALGVELDDKKWKNSKNVDSKTFL